MSVPRPAMFVEIVTAPRAPARAMTSASIASFLAFSTWQVTPAARSRSASRSDSSTVSVPDQHRPARCMGPPDLFDDRAFLGVPMGEDDVRMIDADHRPVRRHDDHLEAVELSQFLGGGLRRAGHATQARDSRAENAEG